MAFSRNSLNKVLLIGHLGNDAELKYTPSGAPVASMSIATNETWKDKDGNQQERTEWVRVIAWGKQAEFAGEYLKKGRQIFVEGKLQTRSYDDKNGIKRYVTEVVANNLLVLGSRPEGRPSANVPPPSDELAPPDLTGEVNTPTPPNSDDLPF